MPGHKRGRYASLRQHLAWIIEHDPKAEQATIAREGLRKDKEFAIKGCGSPKVTGWLTRLHRREHDATAQIAEHARLRDWYAARYTDLKLQHPSLLTLETIAKSRLPWRAFRVLWAALKLLLLRRV